MVTLLATSNSPLVRRMEPETPVASMVSPSPALARAARSVPGPLSAVLVTVMFAAADSVDANITRHPATTRLIDVNLALMGRFLILKMILCFVMLNRELSTAISAGRRDRVVLNVVCGVRAWFGAIFITFFVVCGRADLAHR